MDQVSRSKNEYTTMAKTTKQNKESPEMDIVVLEACGGGIKESCLRHERRRRIKNQKRSVLVACAKG